MLEPIRIPPEITDILWDFNGTLLDDFPASYQANNTMLAQRGLPVIPDVDDYYRMSACPIREFYQRMGFDLERESFVEIAAEWTALYQENAKNAGLCDGALECVEVFRSRGLRQTILSAANRPLMLKQLEAAGLPLSAFDQILGLDDYHTVDKRNIALEWRSAHPDAAALLIGDSEQDAEVAALIGADCILKTGGHRSDSQLRELGLPLIHSLRAFLPPDRRLKPSSVSASYTADRATTSLPDELLSAIRARIRARRDGIRSYRHTVSPDAAQVYYISPYGDDSADGKTPETAWKTEAPLQDRLTAGSEALFAYGGIWRNVHIDPVSGVTYGSYVDKAHPSDEKPRLYGSPMNAAATGTWEEIAPCVWKYSETLSDFDIGGIVMDGGAFTSRKLTLAGTDGQLRDYVSGRPFEGPQSLADGEEDLLFWHDLRWPDDTASYAHAGRQGAVYLVSAKNPAERFAEIEFLYGYGFSFHAASGTLKADDLCLMYYGDHAFALGSLNNSLKDIEITNCILDRIGGAIQFYHNPDTPVRYGNGVEIWGGCERYRVAGCAVSQVYDAGLTIQHSFGGDCIMKNVTFENNLIEYCTYAIEYFNDREKDGETRYIRDFTIRNNDMLYTGYGWGNQRPDKETPAAIKGWGHYNEVRDRSFSAENNLFLYSRYHLLHCAPGSSDWLPVLKGNTFVQSEGGSLGWYGANAGEKIAFDDSLARDPRLADNALFTDSASGLPVNA